MNDSDRRSLAAIARALEYEDPEFVLRMGAQGWKDVSDDVGRPRRRRLVRDAVVVAAMIVLLSASVVLLVVGTLHSALALVVAGMCVVVGSVVSGCWVLLARPPDS